MLGTENSAMLEQLCSCTIAEHWVTICCVAFRPALEALCLLCIHLRLVSDGSCLLGCLLSGRNCLAEDSSGRMSQMQEQLRQMQQLQSQCEV